VTVIYPPAADWFLLKQRPQQLLTAFSNIKDVRSIFISSEAFRPLDEPILQLNQDLYVVKRNVSYDHLVKGKKVLWFSYPSHYVYAEQDKFDLIIFDAIDSPIEEFAHWQKDLHRAVFCADLITCTAQVLYEEHQKSGKPVVLCPNGADFEHFHQARKPLPKPADFPEFSQSEPVIGFYGAMAPWVDFELILRIAERYKVVMVGNSIAFRKTLDHPNITLLEHKDYDVLPFYLAQFSAALVPFRRTDMINGCDPIKFYEYLSAGKPIIATRIPELAKHSSVLYFIEQDVDYGIIEKALKDDNDILRAERFRTGQQNSWQHRASHIFGIMKPMLFPEVR
jgi:glycosyltransferase involved in cell wall biosynthesis